MYCGHDDFEPLSLLVPAPSHSTGQVVATKPAHAVRGPKHSIKRSKTTVLTGEQARELLDSIDLSTVVGLRDRALIALMTFSFACERAARSTRCRRTTISKPISTPTSWRRRVITDNICYQE